MSSDARLDMVARVLGLESREDDVERTLQDLVSRCRARGTMLDAAHRALDELRVPRDDVDDLPTQQSVAERIAKLARQHEAIVQVWREDEQDWQEVARQRHEAIRALAALAALGSTYSSEGAGTWLFSPNRRAKLADRTVRPIDLLLAGHNDAFVSLVEGLGDWSRAE